MDEPLPARAWLVVAFLWVAACLDYLDRLMPVTMRTALKGSIPMTEAQFGLVTTVFLVVYALFSPLGGAIADRWGRDRVIVVSILAWSAATWATAGSRTLLWLLILRGITAVGQAAFIPAAAALVMDYHPGRTRSLANGIVLSGYMAGSGLSGLGGWLSDARGWPFAFSLFGAAGILFGIGMGAWLLLRAPQNRKDLPELPSRDGGPQPDLPLVRNRAFLTALAFWTLLGVASWAFVGWMPTYVQERFHLSSGRAGFTALGCIYAGSFCGMILGGWLADRRSRRSPYGRIQVAILGIAVAVPCIFASAYLPVAGAVAVMLLWYGIGRSFPDANMMPILCQIVSRRQRATAMGLLNGFATFLGGIVIYWGGALRDAQIDVRVIFDVGAVGLALCAGLLWSLRRHLAAPR